MKVPKSFPNGYFFDGKNLFLENNSQPISNFYLSPSKVYRLNDDPLPSLVDIELVQGTGNVPLCQRTTLSQLKHRWWKTPPPGCVFYPGGRDAPRHLQTLFNLLLGQLEPVTIFQPTRLGWTQLPSGEPIYVTGNGAIGSNGFLSSDFVWIPSELKGYQLEQVSEAPETDALGYFWQLFGAMHGITDILLTNALSAILFPCFKIAGVESRFPLVLEGPSGVKKTTLACLTSSLYNRKRTPRGCVVTLTSTKRALELRGANLRHATIIYDDLFPDGGTALERKTLELIRDIANQLPREARSGNSLTSAEMECGAVITSEYFPDCGLSTRTRCLRLVLTEPIPSSLLNPLQKEPELLGNVFAEFITHIAAHFDEIAADIKNDFQLYRSQRAQMDASLIESERLAEISFILCKTFQLFIELFSPYIEDRNELLKNFQKWVDYRLDWQLSCDAMPESGDLVIALLPRVIQENSSWFLFRDGCACISATQLRELLQQYCPNKTITLPKIFG